MGFLKPPIAPMEALSVAEIPEGEDWQYEPKWDGFRCLAFRDGADVYLQSKSEKPLARYFPEVVEAVRSIRAKRFVLDGELVVRVDKSFDFDMLLQRIHPAASRIIKLSTEAPALYFVFDLLANATDRNLHDRPLRERRRLLEAFAAKSFDGGGGGIRLSPATTDLKQARKWFGSVGRDTDGIVAKRLDMPYAAGERTAMVKIKPARTADCVVGGFRYGAKSELVGSLLLGLFDDDGVLHHVGFTANVPAAERGRLTTQLERLIKKPGFTGKAPGGPSRWSTDRSTAWQPLAPKLVVEVGFDHFTGGRFRHATSFLRWRPDKSPRQCTFEQVRTKSRSRLPAATTRQKKIR